MKVKEILQGGKRRLHAGGSPSSLLDAEVLLAHCLGVGRNSLYAHGERLLEPSEIGRYHQFLERRERGEPVAYITGTKEFWSLPFAVTKDVLIPRPATETVVETSLEILAESPVPGDMVLDLGTGSGAIAVALALERPDLTIVAIDRDERALVLARENARKNSVEERIFFVCADLFDPLGQKFAMIVSNPPYIDEATYDTLPSGVKDYEPRGALLAGPLGTEYHKILIEGALDRLVPGGWLVMEIGEDQRGAVERLFLDSGGFEDIHFRKDLAGMDRVAAGRKGQGLSCG